MADRPGWLPPWWIALTAFDTLKQERDGVTIGQVPLYVQAKLVTAVAERAPGGTAVLVDGVWAAVTESPADVLNAITKATA